MDIALRPFRQPLDGLLLFALAAGLLLVHPQAPFIHGGLTALALALGLVHGWRMLPSLAIVHLLAAGALGQGAVLATALTATFALQAAAALLAANALRGPDSRPLRESLLEQRAASPALAPMATGAILAGGALASLLGLGAVRFEEFLAGATSWPVQATGALVALPVLLEALPPDARQASRRVAPQNWRKRVSGVLGWALGLILSGALTYGAPEAASGNEFLLFVVLTLVVLWGALRLAPVCVSAGLALAGLTAHAWLYGRGIVPGLSLQGTVLLLASAALTLSALMSTRKQTERLLRASEQNLRALVQALPDHLLTLTGAGRVMSHHSPAGAQGDALDVLAVGCELTALAPPEHRRILRETLAQARGSDEPVHLEVPLTLNGEARVIEFSFRRKTSELVLAVARDATARRSVEHALRLSEARYALVFRHLRDALVQTDARGRLVFANDATTQLAGVPAAQLLGRELIELFARTESTAAALEELRQCLRGEREDAAGELRMAGALAAPWVHVSFRRTLDSRGKPSGCAGLISDISAKKMSEARIQYLATHDVLTGLPNRAAFNQHLEAGLERARRSAKPLALLFIDLDRFKQVNDTLGHAAGDDVLKEVAARLRAVLRRADVVARLAGDEFVVILEGLDSEDAAAAVTRKVHDALNRPYFEQAASPQPGASVGTALFPRHGEDAESLMRYADTAMYRAKARTRRCTAA